ncbi:hypothetical protein N7462_004175 [Penicillium macrosclerotiorum]|uniref:uncharacterized protein n=1 Tax=Penicillium macrosclerotiorum TaxID=303699 RepID=UPI0025495791|nr:uncharacterized protein N7462_004175 [Penicillium macrosclerotiorum]KAJ5689783.1 hypothetical protein N7462_004175 [Penicillium macrosclerotiorum]
MASLNLSSNGPSISKSYQSVVNASLPTGSTASSTYGQWAVFSVSTPLVNAFQQDAGNKESMLKVQSTGEGELIDLIEEFSEGRVQFAYLKVTDPNSGLPKNVLIAWCGEGVPERTKGYFTSHLASVSKVLHGYHVQITARADSDLSPEGIIQKVADASGSKYSTESQAPVTSTLSTSTGPRPPVASKPVFTPSRSGGIAPNPVARSKISAPSSTKVDDDGWGADAPPVTRTQLEKVQPAYQPTKVNLQQLKSENQSPARQPALSSNTYEQEDVVRGGYQPIGKVDIAAIRKQAAEAGELKDDRPAPVKGSYEPIGKVDIAAIRAKAQKPEPSDVNAPPTTSRVVPRFEPSPVSEPPTGPQTAERLTNLPKPKVTNKFGGGPPFPGTKPPLPASLAGPSTSAPVQVGSASRTFADEGGKTPAQIWAERKAKERGGAPPSTNSEPRPIQNQNSGSGEWKSGYSGKSWAPVQTVQDKAISPQVADARASEPQETENEPAPHVEDIRNQLAQDAPPPPVPQASRPVPVPGLPTRPSEPELEPELESEHDAQQVLPTPPLQPRSPTPPTPPMRESSPIRVAMPVGRSVTDVHEEQQSPPSIMPVQSIQETIPDEKDLEEDTHDLGRATAEALVPERSQFDGGLRAVAQYDYEKSEDNEIDLREGEQVTEIEMVDEDWWLGVNARGERGLFPGNYVEVVENDQPEPGHSVHESIPESEPVLSTPEPATTATPLQPADTSNGGSKAPTATALYDYEAAEDNEISFPEDAKIVNVEFPDDDWWMGEYNGTRGLFPANYVQLDA